MTTPETVTYTKAEKNPFDYDAELKKLTDARNRQRASQYKKMAENPEKSDESLNAQLRKIEDKYTIAVSKLKALARKNGDTRFSADPDIEEEKNGRIRSDYESAAGGTGETLGSGIGGNSSEGLRPRSVYGSEGRYTEVSEEEQARKVEVNKSLHEVARRQLENSGGTILSDADVHPDVRAAGDFIKSMLPGANVSYYSNPEETRAAFFVCVKPGDNNGGFFINTARFNGGVTKEGTTAHQVAVHEIGHFYLTHAAYTKGEISHNDLAIDVFDYVCENLTGDESRIIDVIDELNGAFSYYRSRYPASKPDSQVMEELICELFARNSKAFSDKDAFEACWPLVREWFRDNTDYGFKNANEQALFSADPDIEEENNEQILHSGGPGRRSDVPGRGRVQDATGGEADSRGEAPSDGRGTRSDLELSRRRREEVGILPRQFLEESDWTDEQREVAEKLYDAGFAGVVLFTRDPGSKVDWVGQSWFENGKPTVAVCVNSNRPASKIADHESWHLWLRCLKGDKSQEQRKVRD